MTSCAQSRMNVLQLVADVHCSCTHESPSPTPCAQMEAGKTLDIVRSESDVLQLVADVHCIIAAMMGSNTEVRGKA